VDVTLPAIAADRRRLLHGARSALAHLSIDSPTHMVPTPNPPHTAGAIDRWDRRTDTRPLQYTLLCIL